MSLLVKIMIAIFLIFVGSVVGYKVVRKIRYPYQWKCKQCGFKVETANPETHYISMSSHNHASTEEYK